MKQAMVSQDEYDDFHKHLREVHQLVKKDRKHIPDISLDFEHFPSSEDVTKFCRINFGEVAMSVFTCKIIS